MAIHSSKIYPIHQPKLMQITCFGELSIHIHGIKIDMQAWTSPKVYQLFVLMIASGGENIPAHQICDTLWPDQDSDKALQNFEFILRRLRQTLQQHLPDHLKANQVIQLQQHKLSLNKEHCHIDAWSIAQQLQEIRNYHWDNKHHQARSMEEQIATMIHGTFLEGEEDNIIFQYRHTWHTRICNWIDETLTHWQKQHTSHYQMMRLLDIGLKIDPSSERLLCHRLHILHQSGYHNDAIRYYQDWASLLLQTFGLKPSPKAQQAYQSLLSQ